MEGKQPLPGQESGNDWTVDAKGVRESDGATIIIECRRYTTSKAKQEHMGGLAYRIIDTAAGGGIYVSPLGMQEGAARVAAARNIIDVRLAPDSSMQEFVMQFLNRIFAGVSSTLGIGCEVSCVLIPAQNTPPPT